MPLSHYHSRRVATCEIILLELAGGTRTDQAFQELCEGFEALHQCPFTKLVWHYGYMLAQVLRKEGITIPATDQLIAATALIYGCSLLHRDRHFDLVEEALGVSIFRS